MSFEVHFVGGPWDGETMQVEKLHEIIDLSPKIPINRASYRRLEAIDEVVIPETYRRGLWRGPAKNCYSYIYVPKVRTNEKA